MRVLENADLALAALADHGPGSHAELAGWTGIPRPSIYRIVEGLADLGWVEIDDSSVRLGVGLLPLGDAAIAAIPEAEAARRAMTEVRDAVDQTVFFCQLRGAEMLCVDYLPGHTLALLELRPGRHLPLHAGAAGLAQLSASIPDRALLPADLPKLAERTPTDRDAMQKLWDQTRDRGYSISDEDVTPGVASIGVAVIDTTGRVLGTLSCGGPREEVLPRHWEIGQVLLRAARTMAATVSAAGSGPHGSAQANSSA